MILYFLYRLGYFLVTALPIKVSYALARIIADMCYYIYSEDRNAVIDNLKIILNGAYDDKKLRMMAREVFRNFAKYLTDFFRFSKIDWEYIKKYVKIEGLENVDEGLSKGKGVIILSAHIGNWELGALVLSLLRHPLSAVVLTHKNKKINDFFAKQRSAGNVDFIEIGARLRRCYEALKNNGLLAILGDRDFSKHGFHIEFFGKRTLIPKGPAAFSYRTGACIVPCFIIREKDDNYRFIFEPPIFPDLSLGEELSAMSLAKAYSSIIETYVRRYPTQWYMFRKVWNNNEKKVCSDTGI